MEMHPGKQMFIDDFFIESMTGARRVLNHPEKITIDAPLHTSTPDRPWESATPSGAVHYDEENRIFRMYYPGVDSLVCVIESADGTHWERPNLGLVEFKGSRDNNIVNWPSDCPCYWKPPVGPARDRRHLPLETDAPLPPQGSVAGALLRRRIQLASSTSRDHTTIRNSSSALVHLRRVSGAPMDPDTPYVTYCQRGSSRRTRALGRRESQDFVNWSGMRTVIDQDLDDPPGTEFYAAGHDMTNRTDGGSAYHHTGCVLHRPDRTVRY